MSEQITEEIKNKILSFSYLDTETNRRLIDIGNHRLDFKKTYFLNGFTKKGIKLTWLNGRAEIKVIGKVEDREDYLALYTEGWQYIEHLR